MVSPRKWDGTVIRKWRVGGSPSREIGGGPTRFFLPKAPKVLWNSHILPTNIQTNEQTHSLCFCSQECAQRLAQHRNEVIKGNTFSSTALKSRSIFFKFSSWAESEQPDLTAVFRLSCCTKSDWIAYWGSTHTFKIISGLKVAPVLDFDSDVTCQNNRC